ncbi:MAG: FG-GAP-like repeat-containing protein [Methylococcaceae bacterium]
MDGDGDTDLLAATWNTIFWYKNNDGSNGYTKHVVATEDPGIVIVSSADLDNNGGLY